MLNVVLFRNEKDKKMTFPTKKSSVSIKEYREPTLTWGLDVTISFYAFDPDTGTLRRKRIKLNRDIAGIKGKRAQREYAEGVMTRIRDELKAGWNPWIAQSDSLIYTRWEVACDKYRDYLSKHFNEHNLREETFSSYLSYMKNFTEWVADERKNVRYAYQYDKRLVNDFLDYVYIERDNTVQTRNNYLAWLKVFSKFLLQKSYIEKDPCDGIPRLKKKNKSKNRDVIPDAILLKIHNYLMVHNRHFLLASYLLHYVFVRPHELALLKIRDFNLKDKTLLIQWNVAKNWTDAVVTLPMKVIHLMLDLRIFDSPGDYYLFSHGFRPGREFQSEKYFRDYWHLHVRKDLGFSDRYKFYSLKDTGITNMLRSNTDVLSVRDQARHSSILITDMYTPKDIKKANDLLLHYEGVL